MDCTTEDQKAIGMVVEKSLFLKKQYCKLSASRNIALSAQCASFQLAWFFIHFLCPKLSCLSIFTPVRTMQLAAAKQM